MLAARGIACIRTCGVRGRHRQDHDPRARVLRAGVSRGRMTRVRRIGKPRNRSRPNGARPEHVECDDRRMAHALPSLRPTCVGASATKTRIGSATQVGRKARSPCRGGSIARVCAHRLTRSLYKIDHFQRTRRCYARSAAGPRVERRPRGIAAPNYPGCGDLPRPNFPARGEAAKSGVTPHKKAQ